jgi:small subunit ribosomal protein S8
MYDKLSYFVAILKSATRHKRLEASVPHTFIITTVLTILQNLGFIYYFTFQMGVKNKITVFLKYSENGTSAIKNITRISKPGRRVYVSYLNLKSFSRNSNLNNTFQTIVLSTSKGILPHPLALRLKIGGEVLFVIN